MDALAEQLTVARGKKHVLSARCMVNKGSRSAFARRSRSTIPLMRPASDEHRVEAKPLRFA